MSRTPRRGIALLLFLSLAAGACGNSRQERSSPTVAVAPTTGGSTGVADTVDRRNLHESVTGVPGVSDSEIAYAVIGTKSNNPLGTCILACYLDGIKAYFNYRNSEGGIYGRHLVIGQELDDELAQNQVRALEVTSGGKAFGAFEATLLSSGWGDLDTAGVPTYTWGIQPTDAANRSHIFPSVALRCSDCIGRLVPYAVKLAGAKHVASLGYGISENSKICARTVADSVKLYASDIGADVAYVNDKLDFGLSNGIGPEVTAMKKAGVDFVSTCIDLNGMKTLAQELKRQGMENVTLYHPNTYNQKFVAEAGGIFEGDFVDVQFLPFESDTTGTALGDFQKWMRLDGSDLTELAMVGWINATLAFDGLLSAGPKFDRASVTAATNKLTAFTAGGLIEPIDWATAHTPFTNATRPADDKECGALVRVVDGKFTTVAPPKTPWLCWNNSASAWSDPIPTSFG